MGRLCKLRIRYGFFGIDGNAKGDNVRDFNISRWCGERNDGRSSGKDVLDHESAEG